MARQHILRYHYYSKAEASEVFLSLGILQATIDGWYTVATAEGYAKHAGHRNKGGGELYLSGEELMRLAMKALGAGYTVGQ
jgi:hypothetical protein